MPIIQDVMDMMGKSSSTFHVVGQMRDKLIAEGYVELEENKLFQLQAGGKYFVIRSGTSIIAFAIPDKYLKEFRIVATHNDSPGFKLKPNPSLNKNGVPALNVEPYGGAINYSWLDRPLGLAGQIVAENATKNGPHILTVDSEEDVLVIPSLAIHMNRDVNDGHAFNAAKDMIPMMLDRRFQGDFNKYLQDVFKITTPILSHDLNLYVREKPRRIGHDGEFLLAPRIDDLASAYTALLSFIGRKEKENQAISIFASFDNEEVGSLTRQGAMGDFLKVVLDRIGLALGWNEEERCIAVHASKALSVDNAHANHLNFPELSDPSTNVKINGGIVLKYNAAQHYTTDARSGSLIAFMCGLLNMSCQTFNNRSDMRGGSTLGNLLNVQLSMLTADIGLPQLAMHSAVELCGVEDIENLNKLLSTYYI